MREKGILSTLTVLFISVFVFSSLFAIPISVLDDPDFIPPNKRDRQDTSPLASAAADVTANQYKSGDTATFVCAEYIFHSSTNAGSDCWGWVDGNGTEYGIFASWNYIEFYNTETGELVDKIDAPPSTWHDIKTYGHYCYAVSEGTGTHQGLLVMDMQYLPDSVHYVRNVNVSNVGEVTSHNMYVDTVKGYAYLEGNYNAGSSVHIFSLANPSNPAYVNSFGPANGIHDVFCINDTLYLAEGYNPSFSIWNMANKFAPQLLTRVTIPNSGYVHNIWPSGDRKHVLTTEETPLHTVKVWDMQDLQNIQLMGEYLAPSNLAHNVEMVGDTAYISHYESGVAVVDISDPMNPVELSRYDTYPDGESANFNGCWGVYPYTPSGRFYASDIEGDFYILNNYNVILADTLIVEDAQALPGNQFRVDIWAKFTLDINQFEIPFTWDGPYNLVYDSFSTAGLITDYFESKVLSAYDPWNNRAAVAITSSFSNTQPNLPNGEGVILSLYFTMPSDASGASNPISFVPFNGKEPSFRNHCISYSPDTLNGLVTIGNPPCCVGIRGNVDNSFESPPDNTGIDISDLVYFVTYSFSSGPAPSCFEEADVDASGDLDISDIVTLVTYMFDGGPEPQMCP